MKPLPIKKQLLFFQQLANLFKAGVPITQGLGHLREQVADRQLEQVVLVLEEFMVRRNEPLMSALKAIPQAFPPIVMSLIEQGEATGKLDVCFDRIIDILNRRRKRLLEVQKALAYPVFVASIAILLGPIPAAFKGGFSVYLQQLAVPLVALLLLFAGYRAFSVNMRTNSAFRYRVHKSLIGFPKLGPLMLKLAIARFSQALSMMLSAGLSADRAVGVAAQATENSYFILAMGPAVEGIRAGKPLSESFVDCQIFPKSYTGMLSTGETTGETEAQLDRLADLYESEADTVTSMLLNALGPMILIVVISMVAWQVISEYLKYFDSIETMYRSL